MNISGKRESIGPILPLLKLKLAFLISSILNSLFKTSQFEKYNSIKPVQHHFQLKKHHQKTAVKRSKNNSKETFFCSSLFHFFQKNFRRPSCISLMYHPCISNTFSQTYLSAKRGLSDNLNRNFGIQDGQYGHREDEQRAMQIFCFQIKHSVFSKPFSIVVVILRCVNSTAQVKELFARNFVYKKIKPTSDEPSDTIWNGYLLVRSFCYSPWNSKDLRISDLCNQKYPPCTSINYAESHLLFRTDARIGMLNIKRHH